MAKIGSICDTESPESPYFRGNKVNGMCVGSMVVERGCKFKNRDTPLLYTASWVPFPYHQQKKEKKL